MSNQRPIIIKKVKKVVAGAAHGGAWKVAYADFVTAMMAFFLLMWLLNMSSAEKRIRLSHHFKTFSLFAKGGTSFMGKSSSMFSETGETSQQSFRDKIKDKKKSSIENESLQNWETGGGDTEESQNKKTSISINLSTGKNKKADPAVNVSNESGAGYMEGIEAALKQSIIDKLGDMKDQVLVDTVDDGVRIQMIDKKGSDMFEIGSNRLTAKAKEVLKVISGNINKLPNKVIIEGHTDSIPYSGKDYSNWELSTERASSSRRELEANGLAPDRIIRVAGYADTDPLIKDNPADPQNRRISITLKTLIATDKETSEKDLQSKKKEMDLPALVIPGKRKPDTKKKHIPYELNKKDTSAKKSTVKESAADTAEKEEGWSPVLNDESKTPFIKEEWSPVIDPDKESSTSDSKEWFKKTLASKSKTTQNKQIKKAVKPVNPILEDIKKKEAMKSSAKADPGQSRNKTVSTVKQKQVSAKPFKKLAPLIVREENKSENSKAGNDSWNPVVKDKAWDPVINKNSWNPVLNNN
ncbi:MAG: OmpA family protein [Thermodesulfovibrionia bacterium]|nr:OmpA family protein [Thermodesulfovibrionia bacterium]